MHEEPGFFAEPRNWVVIAFVLFFAIFGRKLWSALAAMLDDRAAKVRAELEEAARLRQEAEAMLRDAEARRAEALREAQALIEGAKAEAGRVAAAAAAEAEASARRREQMALDRIAAAEKAAVDEVRLTAVEVATAAARQVIAEGLSAEADCAADRPRDHAVAECAGKPKGGVSRHRPRYRAGAVGGRDNCTFGIVRSAIQRLVAATVGDFLSCDRRCAVHAAGHTQSWHAKSAWRVQIALLRQVVERSPGNRGLLRLGCRRFQPTSRRRDLVRLWEANPLPPPTGQEADKAFSRCRPRRGNLCRAAPAWRR